MFKVNDLINEQYEVRGWSQGGMGRVYFVFDQVTHNYLVIKMIREDLRHSRDACDRFEKEAKAWINLRDHPHIVRAMSFHRVPLPFLLEEFIDGPSLHALIKKETRGLSFRQAVAFAIHIARGLQHAHSLVMPTGGKGIVHRDLKPHNILISRQCQAKIADFGLAKVIGESSPGGDNVVLGTVQYMPPEQLRGASKVKSRADLYALGVTLYEMITARLPFPRGSWHEIAYHIEKSAPDPISVTRPQVPARLQDFVYACLQKKPAQRPASAQIALAELEAIHASLPREEASPCTRCGYLSRFPMDECLVCGPPVAFPNADDFVIPTVSAFWQCSECGEDVLLDFQFCIYCGQSKTQETNCPHCQTANPGSHTFCCYCGERLGP